MRLPRLIGQSQALDLVLTGRAVGAEEALRMGLVNRVVPRGQAREAAEALARQIAAYPQLCMRGDRRSVYAQADLDFDAAMAFELEQGMTALRAESVDGARRFVGRRG